MQRPRKSLMRSLLIFTAGAMLSGGIAVAVGASADDQIQQTSESAGTPILGIRPTGVGLPLVGAHGTVGAGDYADALKTYHDSGEYMRDVGAVDSRAASYLTDRLRRLAEAKQVCKKRKAKKRKTKKGKAKKRKRKRKCKQLQPGKVNPAMVLDIDETSLSNYSFLALTNFTNTTGQLALAVAASNTPALGPTLDLYRLAKSRGVAVFFITGRPEGIPGVRSQTEANLTSAGYSNWDGLILNQEVGGPAIPYKSGVRAELEAKGFRIIVNVGDQESDLAGGHAERGFKLPNPYYFIE